MRPDLCSQGLVAGGLPVPGRQLVHAGVPQRCDSGVDISEPRLRVDIVELGGGDDANSAMRVETAVRCISFDLI